MSLNGLHQLIALLEAHGELVRIKTEVDPLLEIAAITDRICKGPDNRAILFEHPCGSRFSVATNLFGSGRRMELALGVDRLQLLTERMSGLLDEIPLPELANLDRQIAALPDFACFAPRHTAVAGVADIAMASPDLTAFPFLQTWPGDGSSAGHPRYITLPLVFSADPDGKSPNCGMYRCQVRGKSDLAISWNPGSGAARHMDQFRRRGAPMPVAIALGGDPAAIFSAMMPLPGDLDEMAFAGFLAGEAINMAPCRTVPLCCPATAEVVIEGHVDPAETVMEGPYGNHTGFYSPARPAALMRVTAIRHRAGAVVPATVVGPPPMEDCWMAKAWERLLHALLRRFVPPLAGLHFPLEWIFQQSAIISLENPTPAMVRETAGFLWSTPWFGVARLLLFIDADEDVADASGAAWRSINLTEFEHDIFYDDAGKRLAIDATGCRLPLQRIVRGGAAERLVARRWQEYGID